MLPLDGHPRPRFAAQCERHEESTGPLLALRLRPQRASRAAGTGTPASPRQWERRSCPRIALVGRARAYEGMERSSGLRRRPPGAACDTRGVGTEGQDLRTRDALGGAAAVDLYWLPLGAGGQFVRLNGRAYEALMARVERRPACALYHSALQVRVPEATFVVEQTPVRDLSGAERGVVAAGAVGSRWAGRFRIFRYEIRLWRNGHIPDVNRSRGKPPASEQRRGSCAAGS